MLGTNHAVWPATQVIRNDAVRPSPAGQMDMLFVNKPSGAGIHGQATVNPSMPA